MHDSDNFNGIATLASLPDSPPTGITFGSANLNSPSASSRLYDFFVLTTSQRHSSALAELTEWREDVCEREIGSRVVVLAVPPGWGRSAVLSQFADATAGLDGPVIAVAWIDGAPGGGIAVQAETVREQLAAVALPSRVAELLEADRPAGRIGLAIELAGVFAPGPPAAFAALVASHAVRAAGEARDDGPAGEAGAVARSARAVAAVSVRVPVVVILDDADRMDLTLARALIKGLASRHDGQALVAVAADPGSALARELARDPGYDLAGRVSRIYTDPGMDAAARTSLAHDLLPGVPDAAAERIGARTATFADVFTVAAADRVAELTHGTEPREAASAVDAVVDAVIQRAAPSQEAAVLAWAGGQLADVQAELALDVLGAARLDDDPNVRRSAGLARLTDPRSPRCAEQAAAFSQRERSALAGAVLAGALQLAADPEAGLVERVVARQAVHRIRADLPSRAGLARVQSALIRGLERLGDPAGALDVARAALNELPQGEDEGRAELLAAHLRLTASEPGSDQDPLTAAAIEMAIEAGAAINLEARTWAAVAMLGRTEQRTQALTLAEQVTADLIGRADLGPAGDQWRLLLAFHTGRAGHPALIQRLLASMITSPNLARQKAAHAVLRTASGPHADTRLQIILLEAELATTPTHADEDQLRIHSALAAAYGYLGDYRQALAHGQQELSLRRLIQAPDHPAMLIARGDIASWTGLAGDAASALALAIELLPDQERVLGPDHPDTLTTQRNIAAWTGLAGDATGALRLLRKLLPDQERILGPDHHDTLGTRSNAASWTGRSGNAAGALRLFRKLLPDQERILGPDHPDTHTTRNNIASWTGRSGNAAAALALAIELLHDRERILGPDHPDTLTTRSNIAAWTGASGDAASALRLATDLLHDQERILGPDHPDTHTTRSSIAAWTGRSGDTASALRLATGVLPDLVRLLGPNHPDTLTTQRNIAAWTGQPTRAGVDGGGQPVTGE
jgi:tetratricopeptide (TPR) repeat protein